jgi:uncharacterized protein YgiM (DUF1202 family)
MVHIERAWQRNMVGKATLILVGLLLLVIVVGIPVSIIILLTSSGRQSAEAPPTAQAISPLQITTTATTLAATPSPTPTVVPLPSPSLTPTTAVSMQVQLTITDTNDFVNIRSGPGLTYTVVSRLNKGQTATVIGRNADSSWWLIDINTVRGWVYGLLVKLTGDGNSLPVSQTTSPPN